jgi:hypothetical protein
MTPDTPDDTKVLVNSQRANIPWLPNSWRHSRWIGRLEHPGALPLRFHNAPTPIPSTLQLKPEVHGLLSTPDRSSSSNSTNESSRAGFPSLKDRTRSSSAWHSPRNDTSVSSWALPTEIMIRIRRQYVIAFVTKSLSPGSDPGRTATGSRCGSPYEDGERDEWQKRSVPNHSLGLDATSIRCLERGLSRRTYTLPKSNTDSTRKIFDALRPPPSMIGGGWVANGTAHRRRRREGGISGLRV